MKNKVIGIGGIAGCGKDLFFSLLSKRLPCKRFALADELKLETKDVLVSNYGIDPLTCGREDKDKIRPFLVFHGGIRREQTDGRYWVDKLTPKIKTHMESGYGQNVVVTDVRYDEKSKDEVHWLKEEIGGVLLHLSCYEEVVKGIDPKGSVSSVRVFPHPPNETERLNDPRLKAQADYILAWPKITGPLKFIEHSLMTHVDKFALWLRKYHNE
jgi:hypothetical protein